jgi:hypothetical protein
MSILPRRFVQDAELEPTDVRMFAADGANIPVLETACLYFEAAGVSVSDGFLMSDAVDEPMLGFD